MLLTPAALAAVGGVCTHLDLAVHITAMDGRHLFVERRVELLGRPEAAVTPGADAAPAAAPAAVAFAPPCDITVSETAHSVAAGQSVVWGPHSVVCAPTGLTIPATATLTLLEDVTVIVGVGKAIDVQGALVVTASARQPATFTAMDGRPWGWIHVKGKDARVAFTHAWFLQAGADSANSFGHSMPSQPVVMLQRGTSLTMTGGGFVENIGKALGATDAGELIYYFPLTFCANPAHNLTCSPAYI